MKCCHCGAEVSALYASYGTVDMHCPLPCTICSAKVADPYIERDSILIFLDLVLHKPQVYRHLLFNSESSGRVFLKLWLVLFLVDVYVQWISASYPSKVTSDFIHYYSRALYKGLVSHVLHLACCHVVFKAFSGSKGLSPRLTASALILASFAKGLHILMVIWQYEWDLEYYWLVRLFTITSQAEALLVLWPRRILTGAERAAAYASSYATLVVSMALATPALNGLGALISD